MAGLSENVRTYGSNRTWQIQSNIITSQPGAISRSIAVITFAALLASTVALNAFKIGGFPIRGIVAAGILVLAIIFYVEEAKLALERNLALVGLAAGLAILGVLVSLVNGAEAGAIIRSVTEVHIQAVITLMVAAILAQVAGARACVIAIVAVIGISACFAVAQMLDISSAWAVRRALGPLSNEAIEGLDFGARRHTGLSYSAIQLATQLCLAFAAFIAVRDKIRPSIVGKKSADPVVIIALLALFAASIACATRSPILGGLIFLAAYAMQRRTSWLPLFLILAAILCYMAWPLLMDAVQSNAPRVTQTDDNSAEARGTLVYYGLRLFADNPVGYGLTFAPMTLWSSYWPDLYTMPAPQGVRENDLHNYVVSMLNIYGIGILLLVPIIARLLRRAGASLIFFVPYMVHILFHNSGPFYNDNVIWFVIAAIAAANTASVPSGYAAVSSTARRSRSLPRLGARFATPPGGRRRPSTRCPARKLKRDSHQDQ